MIGGTTLALFNLPTAQKLFGLQGKVTEIAIEAIYRERAREDRPRVKPLLDPGRSGFRTAAQQIKEDDKQSGFFIKILRYLLLAFGFIALF